MCLFSRAIDGAGSTHGSGAQSIGGASSQIGYPGSCAGSSSSKAASTRNGRFAQRNANRRVPGAESSTIVEQTAGKLRKTLFAASSGMTRGGQICIVGPPIPASTRTDVTVGAASRGVISIAVMGLAKPRKTFARVHEARSAKGSVHPRAATMALVTGPLQSRFS